MRSILLVGMAIATVAAAPPNAPPAKLPPIDQCAEDRDFDSFRHKLRQAVARRDRAGLLALFSTDVLVNFGGSRGVESLVKEWEFDAAENGSIWEQFETMLKLGCAQTGEARVIPSLIVQLEPFEFEPFAEGGLDRVLLLPGAMLYESAGVEAADPTVRPWIVAPVTSRAADWGIGVRLPDGREGYVPNEEYYEPAGQRLLIEKRDGKWLITAFVAGD